jgi:cation transport regulator ChaC
MSSLAVFAYGSLVDPPSAAATLGREIQSSEPVRLRGWRRRWSQARDNLASEKTFARRDDGSLPPWCLGLNVEESPDDPGPNGVLLRLTADELDRLDLREMRYDRVEVTDRLDDAVAAGGRVFTYTAKPRQLATTPPEGAVVISAYLGAVEDAFAALGDAELALYRETTGPPPVPVIDAVLVRDRIPAGNPRDW